MSIPIKPIGNLLETDENGYLVNESSPEKVVPPWDAAVAYTRQIYLDNFNDYIHSIYLVGSVSRGMGIVGVSDIDTFAVLKGTRDDIAEFDMGWLPDAQRDFNVKFPFATHMDINIVPLHDVLYGREMHYGIKVRGFCLHGKDLAPNIPEFKPDRELAQYLRPPLMDMVDEFETNIQAKSDARSRQNLCRSIMKWLVRSGMLLVIEKEQAHTLDLFPSYVAFAKHYPHKEKEIRRALELAVNPVADVTPYIGFIRTLALWLDNEMDQVLGK